jgi:predicted O-linked N-acetylglucosamine transferase (SPINDLY family)
VSGDFGTHPVSLFLQVVLEQHDHRNFEIYCYSSNGSLDTIPPGISSNAYRVRDVSALDHRRAAEIVRADEVDILIDLAGHTENNRLLVFAMHPAPVQATWLGYLNTTGLTAMDYRICDRHTDPPGETEALHTERLYRMPDSQWCYRPWLDVPLTMDPHPGSPTVTFGSCNQHLKISDACLDLWCELLRRLPNANLTVLDVRDQYTSESIVGRFARRGIDASRIALRQRQSLPDYYRAIGDFDIALDAYPHNGATTPFDTLWMGVPLVALRGNRGISRASFRILSTLKMPELTADSKQ